MRAPRDNTSQSMGVHQTVQQGPTQPWKTAPLWIVALALAVIPLLLILLVRACTPFVTPAPASEQPSVTTLPGAVLRPIAIEEVATGNTNYGNIRVDGLSYSVGRLSLVGAVRMPQDRYEDQQWQVLWVGDDVVGGFDLDVTDEQIKWYPVTGLFRKQDGDGLLETWSATRDTRCVLHIKLKARAGDASESIYATFDISSLKPDCVK